MIKAILAIKLSAFRTIRLLSAYTEMARDCLGAFGSAAGNYAPYAILLHISIHTILTVY